MILIHIHKNAGSTMCCSAEASGEKIVQPNSNCNWEPFDGWQPEQETRQSPSCQDRKDHFASGGFTYGGLEHGLNDEDLCFEDFNYAVLLREPLSRGDSHMNWDGLSKGKLIATLDSSLNGQSLLETGVLESAKILNDYQVRMLAGVMHLPLGGITSEHVTKAKSRLEKFMFVGLVEELKTDEGRHRIMTGMNWRSSLAIHANSHNSHPERQSDHFTEQEKTILSEHNKYDLALYDWVADNLVKGVNTGDA